MCIWILVCGSTFVGEGACIVEFERGVLDNATVTALGIPIFKGGVTMY